MSGTPASEARIDRIIERVGGIPEGFVRTYGDIDPRAPRLVGRVLATHPRASSESGRDGVPWHRVVRADGSIPMGAPQLERLRREGVPMRGERVDLRVARLPHDVPRRYLAPSDEDVPVISLGR